MRRTRDFRRHHLQRKKDNIKHWNWWNMEYLKDPRVMGIHARTPKRCSCDICGNMRKWEGKTYQEVKYNDEIYLP